MLRPVIRISQNWPLRRARESAGPASRVPALVRLRQAVQPLAERMAHPPPTPSLMGALGAGLRGRLEDRRVMRVRESGLGLGSGDRGTKRIGDAGPGIGYRGCGMEVENQNRD